MANHTGDVYWLVLEKRKAVLAATEALHELESTLIYMIKNGGTTGDDLRDYLILNGRDNDEAYQFFSHWQRALREGTGHWFIMRWTSEMGVCFHSDGCDTLPVTNVVVGILGDNSLFSFQENKIVFSRGVGCYGGIGHDQVLALDHYSLNSYDWVNLETVSGKVSLVGRSDDCDQGYLHRDIEVCIGDKEFIAWRTLLLTNKKEVEEMLGQPLPNRLDLLPPAPKM